MFAGMLIPADSCWWYCHFFTVQIVDENMFAMKNDR
jgi:hypothetical protein